jgi:Ca-activated chloride channel family protein
VDSDQIHEVISGLGSGGGTDMGSGVDLAYPLARASYVAGHENRVIVLSDGDANMGDTSHGQLLERIEDHASRGVTLTTVGFGQGNYNDALMEQVADKGDGAAFYIDSASEARHRFSTELSSTLRTIAKDVKLQVEFNPDAVHSYRLVGYENREIADRDFRNDAVDAGELGSGHQVTALYEIILADDGPSELATVRVRARAPGPDTPAREWATVFEASQVRSELADRSAAFRKAVAVAGFAELLRGSRFTEELSFTSLYRLAAVAVSGDKRDQELLGLITKAWELSGETLPVARR